MGLMVYKSFLGFGQNQNLNASVAGYNRKIPEGLVTLADTVHFSQSPTKANSDMAARFGLASSYLTDPKSQALRYRLIALRIEILWRLDLESQGYNPDNATHGAKQRTSREMQDILGSSHVETSERTNIQVYAEKFDVEQLTILMKYVADEDMQSMPELYTKKLEAAKKSGSLTEETFDNITREIEREIFFPILLKHCQNELQAEQIWQGIQEIRSPSDNSLKFSGRRTPTISIDEANKMLDRFSEIEDEKTRNLRESTDASLQAFREYRLLESLSQEKRDGGYDETLASTKSAWLLRTREADQWKASRWQNFIYSPITQITVNGRQWTVNRIGEANNNIFLSQGGRTEIYLGVYPKHWKERIKEVEYTKQLRDLGIYVNERCDLVPIKIGRCEFPAIFKKPESQHTRFEVFDIKNPSHRNSFPWSYGRIKSGHDLMEQFSSIIDDVAILARNGMSNIHSTNIGFALTRGSKRQKPELHLFLRDIRQNPKPDEQTSGNLLTRKMAPLDHAKILSKPVSAAMISFLRTQVEIKPQKLSWPYVEQIAKSGNAYDELAKVIDTKLEARLRSET